jgi:YebC/PmpR family DNA-binding regulatory protein
MGRGPSIEGRKNAEDAKRAKVFTKLIREITIATRGGVPDPNGNPRLRAAVDKALGANMTRDTIDRAIKRGSGAEGGADMHEIRYEGYGPAGTALIIDCVTDNQTRTVADVRASLTKLGGNLGTTNSVAFQFTRVGQVLIHTGGDADVEGKLEEAAIENNAEDIVIENGVGTVLLAADPIAVEAMRKALVAAGFEVEGSDVVMRPNGPLVTPTGEALEHFEKLLDRLNALDDVDEVYHNAILPTQDADEA